MHLWGSISEFRQWDKFDTPISQTSNGFEYSGLLLENEGNSIFYLNSDANRLAYVGNSIQAIDPIRRSVIGSYQFYIFENNLIVFNGNENEPINNLEKIRKEYFLNHVSTNYYNIYSGKVLDVNFKELGEKLDSFMDSLAVLIGINLKDYQKLQIYLCNHLNDVAYLSGMPSPWQMYGINVNNVAYASSLDIGTIKHESAHWLIHQKIGTNNNNFYVEGFRQYTEYLFDSLRFENDLKITKENMDLLSVKLISGDSYEFFSSPHNYPISGVFVYFLIDFLGFDRFKQYYAQDAINELILQNHNIEKEELVNRFNARNQ